MNGWDCREQMLDYLVKNARVESLQIVSGVYFLLDRGNVVYVGQSTDVFLRVRRHVKDPAKRFDKWAYLEVDVAELNKVEREYIKFFEPYLNKTIVTKVNYRRVRPVERRPARAKFIAHTSGFYKDVEVTYADQQEATAVIDRILRGSKP